MQAERLLQTEPETFVQLGLDKLAARLQQLSGV